MASQTVENYLKTLFNLADEKGEINLSEISTTLNVSTPTANSMVKNLANQGLVNYERYKPVSLTVKGKKAAAVVIRKHRLTEMFLVEKMGFGWEVVHEIAEQIEHINSPVLFDRMEELLGHPTADPHGSPIPDRNGKIIPQSNRKLSDCKRGDVVKLVALTNSSEDFLLFLNSKNISLGVILNIESVEKFDGTITVSYLKTFKEMLSALVCEKLLVE
ncbi:MAG TPA: metal-dependent transcriptional regulator [Chryseolinea sp.]|nr:metal-dependent transcriptional regulator [Chryseolinea sp.]